MAKPMSSKRLAQITAHCESRDEDVEVAESWDDLAPDYAVELLDEVDRLRADLAKLRSGIVAALERHADQAAREHVDGPDCVEARIWTTAADVVKGSDR